MKRVISLWLPRFPTDRLSRRLAVSPSEWRIRLFATIEQAPAGPRIAAVNGAARGAGIAPGLPLADARARLPALELCEADAAGDMKALTQLADWCARYTPWTAVDGSDGAWLDVTGCAHLFGGEAALLSDLATRIGALGFTVRTALADTLGAAWAVARFAGARATAACGEDRIVAPGGTAAALGPLPVAGLRLDPETAAALVRLGLRTIGDLEMLERGALARRFGEATLHRLDQALGRAPEPISPRRPALPYHEHLAFAEPIGTLEAIREATRRLLTTLCARLEADGTGARRLALALYRVDGTLARTAVGTSRGSRDAGHLMGLLADRLESLDSGFGADGITLLAAAEPLAADQLNLDLPAPPEPPRDAAPGGTTAFEPSVAPPPAIAGEAGAFDRLIDRLGNRLGIGNVLRLGLRESHVPERAALARPAFEAAPGGAATAPAVCNPPARPLRLFVRPEPIEVVAELPDAPPALFRRRQRLHRIVRAEGPERIGPEWWRSRRARAAGPRDYYRIEDSEGRRYWVYRDRPWRLGMAPAWYLHGVFA